MASTIKTLTSLTLLPRLQYDSVYEAKPQETLTEGAHVGVLAGNKYTVAQLFHGMMMRSGNDAAVALADAYGFQRTIDAMNAEAQRIGATSTVAKSPNGLDQPGQVTTAKDLAQIYRVAIQDERLRQIMTVREADFPAKAPEDPTAARTTFTIYNNDSLLEKGYPGFLGGKSGFTSQAGRTYVAGADRDGRRYVVALLGIGGGTTKTAGRILDWGYENADALRPIGELPAIPEAERITAIPAGSQTGDDLAPMPLDPVVQEQVTATVANAEQVVLLAQQIEVPSAQDIAVAAQTAAATALSTAGGTPLDPSKIAAAAQTAAGSALAQTGTSTTAATSNSTPGAVVMVSVPAQAPVAAPLEQTQEDPAQRGFFASLLVGLFKTFAWLMLFLGIAVVLLRIRAVRRQKARREQMMRRQQEQTREPVRQP
jgi:D-alanyl-D-alanine carboxypeptidase (penicillin-binding protein 5/6)